MHRIIIDGYNLLFYSPKSSNLLKKGLTLIECITDMLKGFQTVPYKMKKRMVFVFDGNKSAYSNPKEQTITGFKVIFSSPGITADQKIIDFVKKSKNPKSILVVTNDNDILRSVKGFSAKGEKISSFKKRLDSIIQKDSGKYAITTKKFHPMLTETEVDNWLKYFTEEN